MVISSFQALRLAKMQMAGLEPAAEESLQISRRVRYPQNYQHPELHCPQQGDLRLSGPPSGQGAGGGARTRDRSVKSAASLRADSLATVPPTSPKG
ncbi:hypothetical protein PoB_001548200 [Plakobranchus ocellatus]|uniref:Uncharacterized protein n=1 Tax=Plakobranchus ocellatus TaxID=259542 RepID=A0AAV3Z352_9GAST|nr:hypothetical protein PoB_001548200 [Plakobranchus ocellatus]